MWLLRAIAGDPDDVQIMYGLAGERDLPEREVGRACPGTPGRPRCGSGNAAVAQFQCGCHRRSDGRAARRPRGRRGRDRFSWPLQRALVSFMETHWQRPTTGSGRSAAAAAVHPLPRDDLGGVRPGDHARSPSSGWTARSTAGSRCGRSSATRSRTRVSTRTANTYTQYYGTTEVDASLLQLAQVGYCRADDPRMLGTVAAIEADLMRDGLLLRYRTEAGVDGLPGNEHPFLACSFWLVAQYARTRPARRRDGT